MDLCSYGCETPANSTLKNGRKCCSDSYQKCPAIKAKNADGLRRAYKEGRKDCSHFDGKRGWSKGSTSYSDSRVRAYDDGNKFCNPSQLSSSYLRKLIIRENLLPYQCSECKISEWRGLEICLDIDHINGIRVDNRIENLRFLCPNCHSQTPTYKAKNKGRNRRTYTDQELLKAFGESKNVRQLLFNLGLDPKGQNYYTVKTHMHRLGMSFKK